MHSIPVAMTWEFTKSRRWLFLLTLLGMNAVPAFILGALKVQGGIDPAEPSTLTLHFVLLMCQVFSFSCVVLVTPGRSGSVYALPASTWMLTVWRLVPGMAAAVVMFSISAEAINASFDLNWPILGPALFVVVATACIQAALLLAGPAVLSQLGALTSVALILGFWLKTRYGDPLSAPDHLWTVVTTAELATMLVVAAVAFAGMHVGIAWERCGEPLNWPRVKAWFERWIESLEAGREKLSGPRQHALFWFEWQQKGMLLPAGVMAILLGIFGVWAWTRFEPEGLLGGLFALGMGLPFGGIIGGIVFGNLSKDGRMGGFIATRPATNGELANAALKTMGKSVFITWTLWAVTLLVTIGITRVVTDDWTRGAAFPQELLQPGGMALWIGTIFLSFWLLAGLFTAALLIGRPELVVAVICGMFALIISCSLFGNFALRPDHAARFFEIVLYGIGALFMAGTATAFVRARRHLWIAAATPWIALWLWAVLVAAIIPTWNSIASPPLVASTFVAGLLALVVAPFATIPLAIGWNRHR